MLKVQWQIYFCSDRHYLGPALCNFWTAFIFIWDLYCTFSLTIESFSVTVLYWPYIYIYIVSLDFSKASDSVRHSYLAEQHAYLLLDHIFNWNLNLLHNISHCTNFRGVVSISAFINASAIQGSGLGPINFVIAVGSGGWVLRCWLFEMKCFVRTWLLSLISVN